MHLIALIGGECALLNGYAYRAANPLSVPFAITEVDKCLHTSHAVQTIIDCGLVYASHWQRSGLITDIALNIVPRNTAPIVLSRRLI